MSEEFQSVVIEGIFAVDLNDGQRTFVAYEGQSIFVDDELSPLQGRNVILSAHHVPPSPIQPEKWGGGCCYWEPTGKCPAGHRENPSFLLDFCARGVLLRQDRKWLIRREDESVVEVPLSLLVGHSSRILIATVFDPAKRVSDIENLESQVGDLRDMLIQLQEIVGKEK